jgi:starch synthase
MSRLNIAHVASEAAPLAKTGGLADVVGALSRQQESGGHKVTLFLPYYREVRNALNHLKQVPQQLRKAMPVHLTAGMTQEVNIFQATLPGSKVNVILVDNPKAFDRDHLYGTADADYPDNADRFVLFSRAVLHFIKDSGEQYDVMHCHDWQTALIPVYLRKIYSGEPALNRLATVFTIHNLAFQGVFPKETITRTGLGWEMFTPEHLEFYGKVNFLKGGIVYADKLATVSPTYAKEMLTPEHGAGLEGLLKTRESDISGILNGLDEMEWDPAKGGHIASAFSRKNMAGKAACRKALLEEMGLEDGENERVMILGTVSRLTGQKGLDLVAEAIPKLVKKGIRLVVLGTGNRAIQAQFEEAVRANPKKVAARLKFDNDLAHRIYAGADVFLLPSRFEPCGIGQMIAMRNGTVPIVRETGGLIDTVKPFDKKGKSGNGFRFKEPTVAALLKAIDEALDAFKDENLWKGLVNEAMAENFSWAVASKHYDSLYDHAIKAREKRVKGK